LFRPQDTVTGEIKGITVQKFKTGGIIMCETCGCGMPKKAKKKKPQKGK